MVKKGNTLPYMPPHEIKSSGAGITHAVLKKHAGPGARVGKEMLLRYLYLLGEKPRPEIRILDSGTASGIFCQTLADVGFREIYTVDLDNYVADATRRSGVIHESKFCDLSYEHLPWPDDFFDVVTAWCILPHLENPHNFIREVRRVTRPGGIFLLSMPNIASLIARKRFFRTGEVERYTDSNNHIAIFTPAVFRKTIARYFELVAVEYLVEKEKIYSSRLGGLKRLGVEHPWFGQKKFKKWFGSEVFYIVRKPPQ